MKRNLLVTLIGVAFLSGCVSTQEGLVTNYTAEGNLQSPAPASCIDVTELSNTQNPADIFNGVQTCMKQQKFLGAAKLFYAAMSFGYFDTKRVADKTAHQAISVLRVNLANSQSKESMESLQNEINSITKDTTEICQHLKQLGAPTYQPNYMIQHGMGAFLGNASKNGLVKNFDSQTAWNESLNTMAKCEV